MRLWTVRTRTFTALFGVTAASLLVATLLISGFLRTRQVDTVERTLVAEARLAAELLTHHQAVGSVPELDRAADALGRDISARITFLAADGRVLGDSSETPDAVLGMENHATRPEVVQATRTGLGISRRYSATLGVDLLYVAVPVRHSAIAIVRVALPLHDIEQQLASIRRFMFESLAVALACSLVLAWVSSLVLGHRVRTIATRAKRYVAGDFSQPVGDYGDDELGVVARALDDTARELGRRFDELAADRSLMQAILTGMVEGVLVVDLRGRVQLVNGAARAMLALPDVTGRPYVESVRHPDVTALLAAALGGREPAAAEFALEHRTFVARASPAGRGEPMGAVLVLHDITDLRQADRVRRDFVANVSHELRTPLTAIRGYLEAVRDATVDQQQRERFLSVIDRHTARMERLVHELLRLARLEAGQEPAERVRCSLERLLADAIADLGTAISSKRQKVTTAVPREADAIITDPVKLQDAVRNLLENAVIYAPEASTIELGAAIGPDGLEITVADRGPGIPPADLARVFERFYRVDQGRSRDSGGTGLGLAIVKHLVEQLGGRVKAESRAGGGAVFTITLK